MRHIPSASLSRLRPFVAARYRPQTFFPGLRAALAGVCLLLPCLAVAAPFAYIANSGSNNVSVIDTASNSVVTAIAVGTQPYGVAVNHAGTRVYVTNQGSNDVSVIDAASNSVVATITVGTQPYGVAVNPAGTRVYVANLLSSSVSVIDTASNTVIDTVLLEDAPYGITGSRPSNVAVSLDGTLIYVTDNSSHPVGACKYCLWVIRAADHSFVYRSRTTPATDGVAMNPAGTRVYELGVDLNVWEAHATWGTMNQIVSIAQLSGSRYMAVNPAGTRVYVTAWFIDKVVVIDTATSSIAATVALPADSSPSGIALNPAGTRAYVANTGSDSVAVIDTATHAIVATIPVGATPYSIGQFIRPAAAPAQALNDSGQAACYDGSALGACTAGNSGDAATWPRQDGRFGRDAAASAGSLAKTGGGAAGFDFTRVCLSGEIAGQGACPASPVMGGNADDWYCTKDNVTGLVWAIGSPSGAWADANAAAAAANAASRCGFGSGWRLPARRELLSLVHHGVAYGIGNPAIDSDYFPATSGAYWSADTSALDAAQRWVVNFDTNATGTLAATSPTNYRLVRSVP